MKKKYKVPKVQIALCVLSAVLLVLSFPGFDLEFLAWIALVPLLFAIENRKPKEAFFLSYLTGSLFFLGTIYWLVHVTLPGMIAVVLYMALYFGSFGLIASYRSPVTDYRSLFFVPAVLVTTELVRSHMFGGFGWNLLAYSQSSNLPVIQIADITGAYGVSFIICLVNTAIFLTIKAFREKKYTFRYLVIALLLIFLSLSYGIHRARNIFTGEKLRVAVIQGNIPQAKKWDEKFREEILCKYENLTREAAKSTPDLIIWPETSVPGFLESEQRLLSRIESLAKEAKAPILVGTPSERGESYYNSAVLVLDDHRLAGRYDKMHLVPFGEYVPFKSVLSFVERFAPSPIGDFSEGKEPVVFKFFIERGSRDNAVSWRLVKKVGFSCLICFEDIFPDIARAFVKEGAVFLVNITNDAWFAKSSAAYQHSQASIFRAVENRVNVVRAANTGLSCFIDQKGKVEAIVEQSGERLFVDGFKIHDIVLNNTKTLYTKYGDIFAYLCVLFVFIALIRKERWKNT
jgi:apolipoprotein N-acyltransferase